ncbi:MAG: hypothetical protein QM723_36985 [Myxococcaceae bacterium]
MTALGESGLRHTYQRTFWLPAGAAPSCVVEEAILALAPRLNVRVAGYEWWLSRMRTSNVGVDFHRDHDIALATRGGPMRHPKVSTVLFLNRCRGGLLAITRGAPNPANPALAPDVLDFELVEPRPNRWCFFDGKLTHGVLDSENQVPHARRPREAKLRLSIPVNFWTRRPDGVPEFARTRTYPPLRNPKFFG